MIKQQEFLIRLANPETNDYERCAELLSITQNRTITADILREYDAKQLESDFIRRYVACLDEIVIAYGMIFHSNTAQIPQYLVWVGVFPEYRGNGYGSQLYQHVSNIAKEQGATEFHSDCMDNDPVSLAFAKKRGFEVNHHSFESVLDITTFDETPFSHIIEEVKQQGIRFTSLAAEGNTEEAQYKVFLLDEAVAQDETANDGTYVGNFENFKAHVINAYWFRADGQILAVDGERYVGLVMIGFDPDGITGLNISTGVEREYRGRKIAQALKLQGIRYAKSKGLKRLVTHNDSENVGMLAINDKLGYVRQPGFYKLINRQI